MVYDAGIKNPAKAGFFIVGVLPESARNFMEILRHCVAKDDREVVRRVTGA